MKPGKVQGKDSTKTSAASAPYSLPGMSGGRSISQGKENNMTTKKPAAHTPGPWTSNPEKLYKGMHVAGRTAIVLGGEDGLDKVASVPRLIDAHLISAAPDLLAASQVFSDWIERVAEEVAMGPDDNRALNNLRAAIAKATGDVK